MANTVHEAANDNDPNSVTLSNIIPFPVNKIVRTPGQIQHEKPVETLEEAVARVAMARLKFVNDSLDFVIPMLFKQLSVLGFGGDNSPQGKKTAALVVESLKSYLLFMQHIHHPIQDLANQMFEDVPGGGSRMHEHMSIQIGIGEPQQESGLPEESDDTEENQQFIMTGDIDEICDRLTANCESTPGPANDNEEAS